jgi:toxin ParE1/3/4
VAAVRLSGLARADLLKIWQRIAAHNSAETADNWIDRIQYRCRQLAAFPKSGPSRPDIAPGARMLVVARWLLLYRIEADGVRIVRVVDAAQNLGEIDLADS